MSSVKLPFKKRSDPFDNSLNADIEQRQETSHSESARKPLKRTTRSGSAEKDFSGREKYTATMSKDLRKRVKLASIKDGVLVSAFIEQACKDKLEREGY
ncbi:MAG: hypothetical protein WCR33_00040 [Bacilli bacterium]